MNIREILNAIKPYVLGWISASGIWTPGYTGFSVNPTPSEAIFIALPQLCFIHLRHSSAGTSNATSFTITGLPIPVKAGVTPNCHAAYAMDNSAALTGPVRVSPSGTTLTLFKDAASGAWTASGSKYADIDIWYPI